MPLEQQVVEKRASGYAQMIDELQYIRFTTCGADSMFVELGVDGRALEIVSGHYEKIYESSERALIAAGFGPMLVPVALDVEPAGDQEASDTAAGR